jgi:uncharacterized membrane protein YkgB
MISLALFEWASHMDGAAVAVTRLALIVVLVWIGGLKAAKYEADSIVPFVANSPFMRFFYADRRHYRAHMNPEGAVVPANRAWHEANGTYPFAHALGLVIVLFALMLAVHPWLPQVATVGSAMVALMSLTTLSFLVTTPEAWVPAVGDTARPPHSAVRRGNQPLHLDLCLGFGCGADSCPPRLHNSGLATRVTKLKSTS